MKRDMIQNAMSDQNADVIIDKVAITKINVMIYRDPMHECGGILLGNVSYGEFQVMDAFCLVDSEVSRISEDITMGNADCGATLFAGGWISEKENYGSRDFRQRIFRFTGRAAQLSKCYYYFNGRYYKGIDIDIAALEDGTRTYEQNLISQDEYQTAMDSYKKLSINTYELSEENIRAVKTAALNALGESEAYPQRDR